VFKGQTKIKLLLSKQQNTTAEQKMIKARVQNFF